MTTIRRGVRTLRAAHLGEESPLPRFTPLRALPETPLAPGAPPAMVERAAYGRLRSPLPYRVQEDYDRDFSRRSFPVVELDNGVLRATVLPSLGGRLWSLYDLVRDRELLFVNPVLAFANFGLANAWAAGGIEWNLGSTGHSCMSSRPVHAAVVDGPEGPMLRLWEWERTRDLVLQLDLSLPPGSDRLYVSTRVLNPDPEDKPLYYWTNIAVPETLTTRVLTTATHAWRTDYRGVLGRVAVPHPDRPDVDVSRPASSPHAVDYFYEVEDRTGRHVAAVEADGHGFAQTSTSGLTGRKLFCWGQGRGGATWQEWLCGPGARYAEIQAGRCATQLEHDRLSGHGIVAWTEAFGAVDLDRASVAAEYDVAATAARDATWAAAPPDELERRHEAWLAHVADAPVREVLALGSGWGFAERLLRGDTPRWASALPFPEVDDDSAPAVALLRGDAETLDATAVRLPVPPVSDRWAAALSAASSDHWWVDLSVAVNAHLRGDADAARASYARSEKLHPSAWACRGLAVLAAEAGREDEAIELFRRARERAPEVRGLVTEQLRTLLAADRPARCLAVIGTLPATLRNHGRTRLLEARALHALDRDVEAEEVLHEIVVEDLAEGENALGDLWRELHPDRPLPAHLDFTMGSGHGE